MPELVTINVSVSTKEDFENKRREAQVKEKKNISQDEFQEMLLKGWSVKK